MNAATNVEALRLPPHSIEAEQAVLGALLVDNKAILRTRDTLTESDFYRADHRAIFRALLELGECADVITVMEALRASDRDAGGLAYLHQLAQSTPSSAAVESYAGIVAERARQREIAGAMTALADSAMQPRAADSMALLLEGRKRIDEIEAKISRVDSARARTSRVWLDQAELPAPGQWLVKGLIGARDLVLVYGQTSCGKTFWTIDLVASIAADLHWRERRTRRALVVYVAAEAGQTIMRRFVAWRDRNIGDARETAVPLAIIPRAFNLLDDGQTAALLRNLRELGAEAGMPVGMVVIDTLSRSIAGGDENSAADMTRAIAAVDRIRDEIGSAVLLIHHSGKDAAKGARGHSALAAAADSVVAVADHVALFEKVRDGSANVSFPFDLEVVELGRDDDGDAITTCVAVSTDAPPQVGGSTRIAGLGKNQEKALAVLRRLLARYRKNVAERGDDPSAACVLISGWRAELERNGIDYKRFHEVRTKLEERGLIKVDGPHVMPIEEPSADA